MNEIKLRADKKLLTLLIFNTFTFLAMLFANYAAGTGIIGNKSVGEISDIYQTLITPAGYAFSIWGLIYLMLSGYVGYQWYGYFNNRNKDSLQPSGLWFMLSNIANGLWIIAWVNEALGLSVLIMAVLLLSLIQLIIRLRLEIWNAPLRILAFVWWPICIYIGWIILATVLNVSVWLKSLTIFTNVLSPEIWAVIVICVATFIYAFLIYKRNMREAAMVGCWGLIAIAAKQWGIHEILVFSALLATAVLLVYSGIHAYKNLNTLPHVKLKNKEF